MAKKIAPSRKQKLRYMKVLEHFGMNYTLAAKNLGISRQSLAKYHAELWDDYEKTKDVVLDDSLSVEIKKLEKATDLDLVVNKCSNLFDLALEKITEILHRDETYRDKQGNIRHTIELDSLAKILNAVLPYIAEKRVLLGANDADGNPHFRYTTFVQNIVNVMNKKNTNQIEETQADDIS